MPKDMKLRQQEYKELNLNVRWLDQEHAQHAYDYALKFSSPSRYGLNESTVANIEQHIIEGYSVADHWLKNRLNCRGTVQIVYSETEACVINAESFLQNWQQIFVPARDDAIILHNLDKTVVFYCHEEELEVGQRQA